ncbi:GspH/FimT family pseudopilin [Undibacterium seohonense]|nr:GspH/FimT family pseudopilin [Undibacterium seohonense]
MRTPFHRRFLLSIQGFTMVELIMVMLIVGILSAIALPRFMSRTEFDSRGFFDQTQSMIRYAQKTAIAQRRPVWVQINQVNGLVCLTYAPVNLDCSSDGGVPVLSPEDQSWFKRAAPTGVSFDVSRQFSFDALGQAGAAIAIVLYQDGATTIGQIRIEAETGYVH